MRHPWFLFAAIVLIVFCVIATAITTGSSPMQLFGVQWYSWLAAALLAFLVHLVLACYGLAPGWVDRRVNQP